ncbi:DUF4178 domain-containing protein [Sphingomonas sp.]|uniref:DUF4178 domain-containing protein n=1 Tax=Sphingomonas sp. TaxID=28214 RepID=UPI001B2F3558|nr:DUF4178 domain-containing protein [Sphingomonas sp.]MBO9713726.1 DUF4178 domain-containing protein [Sphingomonas sp.]
MPADDIALPPAPAAQALSCPACGGTIELRAAGYSVSVGCQYCSSVLDVSEPAVRLITRYAEEAWGLDIPLGTRGTIEGVEWEAIGHMRRSIDGAYPWQEYLLFNPYHGYRWLVNANGAWSFGEMLAVNPDYVTYDTLGVGGQNFTRFFADSSASVDSVVGEFYWQVRVGERVEGADWVRPGWMLSRESNGNEVSWTLLELLDARVMKAAFGVDAPRNPWPPPPHASSPHGPWVRQGVLIGIAVALLLMLVTVFLSGSTQLAQGALPIAADGHDQTATIGPIVLGGAYQRVNIRAQVPKLENGWVDLDYSLVDRKTQQSYQAYAAAERYSGHDSDGYWTEGSRGAQVAVATVPAGTYDLVVDYKGNVWGATYDYLLQGPSQGWMARDNQPEIAIEVSRGGLFFGNLILALIILFLPLIWGAYRHLRFEQARQGQSDFPATGIAAMVNSSGDDDE